MTSAGARQAIARASHLQIWQGKFMAAKAFEAKLNEICELFFVGSPTADDEEVSDIFGMTGEHSLTTTGKNRIAFRAMLGELHNMLGKEADTISRESLRASVVELVREAKVSGQQISRTQAQAFQVSILASPVQSFRVVKPIYGINLTGGAPVKLGDFVINKGSELLHLKPTSYLLQTRSEELNYPHILCTIRAREPERALEISALRFYSFELLFRFFVGKRTRWIEVGVDNYIGRQSRESIIMSEDNNVVHTSSSWKGSFQPFIFGDPKFPKPDERIQRLFGFITSTQNDFERHILRCAEWTGQAIAETNEASAHVKAATALEVLFSTNEKGPITPSIMAQISESCALILGKNPEEATKIESDVKRLYGIRSAVVHSGKDTVESADLALFILLCRNVLAQLLGDPRFREMKSMSELTTALKQKRYAGCASD